jgi:predicted transcriptional regulator
MPTLTTQALGPTETAIMNVLWSYDAPMTIQQVHTVLLFRGLAYTTVMTTMDRLAEKGILTRGDGGAGVGGAYRYMPALTRGALLAASVEQLCGSLGADCGDRALALAVLQGTLR